MNNPTSRAGPDKQVPPNLEGHACRARGIWLDYQIRRTGRDERVPPRGQGQETSPQSERNRNCSDTQRRKLATFLSAPPTTGVDDHAIR